MHIVGHSYEWGLSSMCLVCNPDDGIERMPFLVLNWFVCFTFIESNWRKMCTQVFLGALKFKHCQVCYTYIWWPPELTLNTQEWGWGYGIVSSGQSKCIFILRWDYLEFYLTVRCTASNDRVIGYNSKPKSWIINNIKLIQPYNVLWIVTAYQLAGSK